MSSLVELAVDWSRIETWCEHSSGKAICGPVLARVREKGEKIEAERNAAMDCMNYAWTIICNVSEGDWTKQTQEWQDAAARCRDQYHALLDSIPLLGES